MLPLTVMDAPTPTLPAKSENPVTLKVFNLAAESEVMDEPTPKLPSTVKTPVNLPVPQISRLYAAPADVPPTPKLPVTDNAETGAVVPIPNLP